MPDFGVAKTGTLVAAALESAGIEIQAEMLDIVSGENGQILGGYFLLFSIISAMIIVAIGGEYKFARYLMVAPPLFFFFTQVRTDVLRSEWQFGDRVYARQHMDQAMYNVRIVQGGQQGGDYEVSYFFHFWNVFMSDLSQELIRLLKLTSDGSDQDFLKKIDRYMNFWLFPQINDEHLQMFIRVAMFNKCTDYYQKRRDLYDPNVDRANKDALIADLNDRSKQQVITIENFTNKEDNKMMWWLVNKLNFAPGAYTCDQIWTKTVEAMRPMIAEYIVREEAGTLGNEEQLKTALAKTLKKMGESTNKSTGQTDIGGGGDLNAQMLQAVDWVIAGALWKEMTTTNKYTQYFDQENHSGYFATAPAQGFQGDRTLGGATNNAISQFNRTEVYQFKGDFVNAAMSLPYYQGILLMLLAASYPFFAMAMLLPSRSGAMFTWMSLWAWAKLWDVGFAVVMMIDNMLYVMFPRAPGMAPGEINDPGRAWSRIMEIDPSYSAAAYYNIIATCMFAVPLVTGVFVKGGASELKNILYGSYQGTATRLAASAATYARAMQSQTFLEQQRRGEVGVAARAEQEIMQSQPFQEELANFNKLSFLGAAGEEALKGMVGADFVKAAGNYPQALANARALSLNKMTSMMRAHTEARLYEYSTSSDAYFTSERMVAARYYSHDTSLAFPGKTMMGLHLANNYTNEDARKSGQADGFISSFSTMISGGAQSAAGGTR